MSEARPVDCTFRLQDEGKPYPRSGCAHCGRTITSGLGRQCHHETDRIEALEREKEELRKERDRCHARLEIDHCFKLGDDDNLIRHEIPLNERSSFPDGITARDETIKLVERRAETAERQLAERDADLARKNALLLKASVGFEPFSEVGNAMTFAGVTANDEIELAGERLRPALVAAVTIKREIDLVIAVPASPSTAGER